MATVASLFSGCGGLDLGFKEAGFDLVYACDHDSAAVDAYRRNVDARAVMRDVSTPEFDSDLRELGSADVVLGGFPCQGFSKAGPKRLDDERNELYAEMRSAIETLRPRIFVAENVDGMAQNFGGSYVARIVLDLGRAGYRVEARILEAATLGLPQHRRRIFFVGIRSDVAAEFGWPAPTHAVNARNGEFRIEHGSGLWNRDGATQELKPPRTISDAISDLVEVSDDVPDHAVTNAWPANYEAIFRHIGPGQKLCNVRHASTSVYTWDIPEVFGSTTIRERSVLETIARHRRHLRYGSIPNGNPLPIEEIENLSGIVGLIDEVRSLLAKGYLKELSGSFDLKGAMFCSGMFKRPLWDGPSPTVLTNFHNPRYFVHPLRDRPFTLRECARLQGFPDDFIFSSPDCSLLDGYRLVGNAVPVPVGRAIAASVSAVLRQPASRVA